ncbi:MAG: DciA family protein [Planctomycetota bacterium]
MDPSVGHHRLERLRGWRNRAERASDLGFLGPMFQRDVARPWKKLGPLAEAWQELVPADLAERSRLEGLSRGVLHVAVPDSSTMYALDVALRSGLQTELSKRVPGATLRKVRIAIDPAVDPNAPPSSDRG